MKPLLGLAVAVMLAGCGDYSDGTRVGVIQKFSHKGLLSKTWEGEMLLGGLKERTSSSSDSEGHVSVSSSMVANVWAFTVEDPALIFKVEHAMQQGIQVRAHYRQEMVVGPLRSDTGIITPYFLTGLMPTD